jgi:hypothetical protein
MTRTRADGQDDLPTRIYLRRGVRVWTWFYKNPRGRNHVIANARPGDEGAIADAVRQAHQFAKSERRRAIDLSPKGMERRALQRLRSEEKKATGLPGWAWRLFRQSQSSRTTDRPHLVWTLTAHEFAAIVRRANGRCEVSGLEFELQRVCSVARGPFGPSIDRINSQLGYTAANVRIVCVIVNIAMGAWGEQALFRVASAIIKRRDTGLVIPNLESNPQEN